MKSESTWAATKFVRRNGKLRASRNPAEVGVGSRMIGDLVARFYDQSIGEHATGNLIDLGCGKVPLYGTYRDHVSSITCVDWAAPTDGTNHLDSICNLADHLPFNDEEFQTVILSDVLEHIPEPQLLWSELARLLSPGGKILMNTPFLHCLHEQPHDYYRFTDHALRRFAEANGFEVVLLEPLGGTPEVLTDITAKHLQFVPVVGKLLARAIQAVTYWFVNTKPGKALSQRTGDAFPLGYTMVATRMPSAPISGMAAE